MKKLLCMILVFALCLGALPSSSLAEADDEANGSYDPFAPENANHGAEPDERHIYERQSGYKVNSFENPSDPRYMNILLSQIDHTSATVCFTGNYALCDASDKPVFQIESEYAYTISVNGTNLELRAADGQLLYSAKGFIFKEYAPPSGLAYNYFKLAQVSNGTSPSDRIYRGELNCYYMAKSGLYTALWAGLYLVNRIYIEDYLKGVLPAEIGTGKPAAAQQAQAVVARNFSVKSKRTDGRIFDVYDYNRSQVYFGLYSYDDTDAAVSATAGKVLTYNGSVIRAYYGNTNGGYTEISTNEWSGEGQSGPESVRYDEYDLMATSYVEEVTVPAVVTGSNARVSSLIVNALIPKLSQMGYTGLTATDVTVTGIAMANGACYNASCRHHDGSDPTKICTHFCSLDVTFSGVAVHGTALLSPVTVNLKDIDFYVSPANGRPLGFFSNGELSHYWLVANAGSYTIRHARNGSGVGLSQQGAIKRANAEQNLAQILDFYFPYCSVAAHPNLGAADVPGNIASVSFQRVYDVLGRSANVYEKADGGSTKLGVIPAEGCAQVISTSGDWVKISRGALSGYILKSALTRAFVKLSVTNISSSIEIRSAPNASAASLGKAYPGDILTLLAANSSGYYHKVRFNGKDGYLSARYARLLTAAAAGEDPGPDPDPDPDPEPTGYPISVTIPKGFTDTRLWVDGVAYRGTLSGGVLSARIPTEAAVRAVVYQYNARGKITGVREWKLAYSGGAYTATPVMYPVSVPIPAGYTDMTLWVDGVAYTGVVEGGMLRVMVPTYMANGAEMRQYNDRGKIISKSEWALIFEDGAYTAVPVVNFTNPPRLRGTPVPRGIH